VAYGPDHAARWSVALDATPLLGVRSGVGRFCAGALDALGARSDLEVSAFAVTWRRRRWLTPEVSAGVATRQRPMPARPLSRAWRRTPWPSAEWFIGSVDVVHGTNFVVPPTRSAGRVVTVHDLTTLRFPEMCDPATLVFPKMVRRAIAEGAWVHTPSQFVADEVIAEFGADPGRVRAIHHGVDQPHDGCSSRRPQAGPGPEALFPEPAAPGGPKLPGPYLLAVGTIEPRKDYPGLVAAFDRLATRRTELSLVVAGSDGWGTEAFERALDEAHHRDRVVRAGYLDEPSLDVLRRGAAALVFPSRYEGFGFPPLEAMAAGVPVVATAVGAVPEVVGDAAVLVPPGDPDALAGAVDELLQDDVRRASLVDAGRRRVAGFTWDACGDALASLYRDIVSSR
jgi:glycosyltransferase involved in cell wall biosynthesis